jgi:dTDP-L-rhamnose 4-epimerase
MSKRILITGGAGFIGSHLARELANAGYTVRVLDNFSAQVHGKARKIPEILGTDIEVIEGDVCSSGDLTRALRGIDVVYHFAASVGVGQSMYEIKAYIDNNNGGTANLLQTLIDQPVERLIVASSMSLYGEGLYRSIDGTTHSQVRRSMDRVARHEWEPRGETGEPLAPLPTPESKRPDLASIYALSKYDQEQMCLMVGQAYKIPTVALRFFNVYGPGQALSNPYTGVMAIFASRLLNNNPPLIFEDGNQKRDFVHVSDVAQACRLALEVPEAAGNAFNIGSGNHYTIQEIATRMARALGKEQVRPEITQRYRVGDIRHCFADITLARNILGYKPRVALSDGMKDLVDWLKDQRAVDRTAQASEELTARGLAI